LKGSTYFHKGASMNSAPPKVIETSSKRISCDGGGGALGHPKVYFEFKAEEKRITCSYCGQVFERVAP